MLLSRPGPRPDPSPRAFDRVFASIAGTYDLVSKLLSMGQDTRWKERLLRDVPPLERSARILDLATGSGAIPAILRSARFRGPVWGIDRSAAMLARARRRGANGDGRRLLRGELHALPFPDGSFDFVSMAYGLRYVDEPERVFREVHRVLRPGGSFVCLELGAPRHPLLRILFLAYLAVFGTLLGLLLNRSPSAYWHIPQSLARCPGRDALSRRLAQARFEHVTVREEVGGISVSALALRIR